jgi:hypothetical protein
VIGNEPIAPANVALRHRHVDSQKKMVSHQLGSDTKITREINRLV